MPSFRVALAATAMIGSLTVNMGSVLGTEHRISKDRPARCHPDAPVSVGKNVEVTGFISLGSSRTYIHKTSSGGSAKLFLFTGELSRDDQRELLLHCSDALCPAILREIARDRDGDIDAKSVKVLSLSEAMKIMGMDLLR